MNSKPKLMVTSKDSRLYPAIKKNKMEEIKLLLRKRRNLNDPVVTTGPFAGYTALHVACMENNDDLVELLVNDYKVDVNVVAEDRTQPIHLACFYEPFIDDKFHSQTIKLHVLLKAKANANAEVDREMFSKHVKDRDWCPDFGDRMTLGTYTVIYNKPSLTDSFACLGADLKIISLTNKTLAMYMIEKNHWDSLHYFLCYYKNPQSINHRDNDGIPATHYLFHPKKYGDYRYDANDLFGLNNNYKHSTMASLFNAGADKYALLNDDPATFLPNVAAYRGCSLTLKSILPFYTSMPLSKALYYATFPVDETSDYYLRIPDGKEDERDVYLRVLREDRQACIEVILKDLINRLTFGLSVPESEKQLMDKLIATDAEIRNFVHNYQTDFIQGELKNKLIEVNDKKMTLYDFITEVYDDRKLKLLTRDENLHNKVTNIFIADSNEDYRYFTRPLLGRIDKTTKRLQFLKGLQKISTLRKAIPLPYEIILDIIEYLSNEELDIFIQAFIRFRNHFDYFRFYY